MYLMTEDEFNQFINTLENSKEIHVNWKK